LPATLSKMAQKLTGSTWKPEDPLLRSRSNPSFRYDENLPLKNSRMSHFNAVLADISTAHRPKDKRCSLLEQVVSEVTINAIKEAAGQQMVSGPLRLEFSDDVPALSGHSMSVPIDSSPPKRRSYSPSSASSLSPKSKRGRRLRAKSLMAMSVPQLRREYKRLKIRKSLSHRPLKGEIVSIILDAEFGESGSRRSRKFSPQSPGSQAADSSTWTPGKRRLDRATSRRYDEPIGLKMPKGFSQITLCEEHRPMPTEKEKEKQRRRRRVRGTMQSQSGLPRPRGPHSTATGTVSALSHSASVPPSCSRSRGRGSSERTKKRRNPRKGRGSATNRRGRGTSKSGRKMRSGSRKRSGSKKTKKGLSKTEGNGRSRAMDKSKSPSSSLQKRKYVSFRYDEMLPNSNTTVDAVNALLGDVDRAQNSKEAEAKLLRGRSLDDQERDRIYSEAVVDALSDAVRRQRENDESAIDDEVKEQLLRWSYSEEEILAAYQGVVDKGNIMAITNAIEDRRRRSSTACSSI